MFRPLRAANFTASDTSVPLAAPTTSAGRCCTAMLNTATSFPYSGSSAVQRGPRRTLRSSEVLSRQDSIAEPSQSVTGIVIRYDYTDEPEPAQGEDPMGACRGRLPRPVGAG